jgi:glucose/arabinose dehydrogenase
MKKTLGILPIAAMCIVSGWMSLSTGLASAASHGLADPIMIGGVRVQLETVATGLTAPNWGTSAPGDPGRLFVTDQDGILWAIDLATGDKSVFLDISARLVPLGFFGPGSFDERGLLGVAFHPDYVDNGLLYTYTSEPANDADFPVPLGDPAEHESVIIEWQVPDPSHPDSVVAPASARVLLRIGQPQFNHDGGALNFGPDDMLYISLGDGGNRDDEGDGHSPEGNGQDPSNVLGSILRIDPLGNNSANGQYGVPADNPFFPGGADPFGGEAGCSDGFCDEIFAYGFRNPFRFSFDMERGDLYVGDVGQDDLEEVDVVVAGGNYGWNLKEGSFCFDPNGTDLGFAFDQEPCPDEPPGLIDPIAQYNTADDLIDNEDGRAVIGGFVYRGSDIPALGGRYVFGDFSRFTEDGLPNNDGSLFFLNKKNVVRKNQIKTSKIVELHLAGQERLGKAVLGFGQDGHGEVYVLANDTGVPFGTGDGFGTPTGVVLRIARAAPDAAQAGSGSTRNFRAHLSGRSQPTPVDTRAQGQAIFQLSKDGTELAFKVIVAKIENVIGAHIHLAPAGQNGPIVLPMLGNPFIPDPGVTVNGVLVEGTATAADVTDPLAGDLDALVEAMRSSNAYVNVHTTDFRPGEIRGQVR